DILQFNEMNERGNALAEAIEQIRSKVFLKRVVEKLDISVNYFSEGTFKNSELYHASPYLVKVVPQKNARYGQNMYVELNEKLTGGILKVGGIEYPFEMNSWIKTPGFDVNIYINTKITPDVLALQLKEKNEYYFVVEDIDVVTAKLQNQVELKLLSELAKTIRSEERRV